MTDTCGLNVSRETNIEGVCRVCQRAEIKEIGRCAENLKGEVWPLVWLERYSFRR
jgi:hypothetical protein